ncbi:MAG: glycosyltransferase family 2 protein [Paludibacteraceae bacterium]|nr:glycosyltransferase family 2 protein [Paludibacteraceae bacterium]
MKTPIVSIIMPCYNSTAYIQEAVESVIAQTFSDWELIIVDDCSTDPKMASLLQTIASQDTRISFHTLEHNSGPGAARNLGIKMAKGRFIAFLDSDDYWYPHKLSEQLMFMQQYQFPFTCTYYEFCNATLDADHIVTLPSKLNYQDILKGFAVGLQGTMIDTHFFGKTYMPETYHAEDWQLWLQLLKKTDYLYVYPQICWKYRRTKTSTNSNKIGTAINVIKVYQKECNKSFISAFFMLLFKYIPHYIHRKRKMTNKFAHL